MRIDVVERTIAGKRGWFFQPCYHESQPDGLTPLPLTGLEASKMGALFEAAPELLEACQIARITLQAVTVTDPRNISARLDIKRMEAAIALATGHEREGARTMPETKHADDLLMSEHFRAMSPTVATLGRYDLDSLEEAIHVRRMELMANILRNNGFTVTTERHGAQFRYLCVGHPDEFPAEWATLDECNRLLDTVANLPAVEAFRRWRTKIAPLASAPYTKADAERDKRTELLQLRQEYAEGQMDGIDLNAATRNIHEFYGKA